MDKKKIHHAERGFSTNRVKEEEIQYFCDNYVYYHGISFGRNKERLKRALTETLNRSPTARASFRACWYNVAQMRKINPTYKIQLNFSDKTDGGFYALVDSHEPNKINIYPKIIDNLFDIMARDNKKEHDRVSKDLFIGTAFLHEASHVRQFQNKDILNQKHNLVLLDAAPQALSHMIALETGDFYLLMFENINNKEGYDYFSEKKEKMAKIYTKEFVDDISKRPYFNHTRLGKRWGYTRNNFFQEILQPSYTIGQKEGAGVKNYLKEVNGISIRQNDTTKNALTTYFTKNFPVILEKATQADKDYLFLRIINSDDPNKKNNELKESQFSSKEVYEASKMLMSKVENLNENIEVLTLLSGLIHSNVNSPETRKELLKKSNAIRNHLKETYGIIIPSYNQKGERIAVQKEKATVPDDYASSQPKNGGNLLNTLAKNGKNMTDETHINVYKDTSHTA